MTVELSVNPLLLLFGTQQELGRGSGVLGREATRFIPLWAT